MYDIRDVPAVKYHELDSNPAWTGEGSQIPIFIGTTGMELGKDEDGSVISTETGITIRKFKNYANACKTKQNGGIGTKTEGNLLLTVLKDFFKESAKKESGDVGVSYVYVIDVGSAGITESDGRATWLKAMDLAKSKRDVELEVYVGLNTESTYKDTKNTDVVALMESAYTSILTDSEDGSPRIAYFTLENATDEQLIAITNDSKGDGKFIQHSRIGLIEPTCYGRSIARICVTPYYEEPGYEQFRTIDEGIFNKRTPEEEKKLQEAGVIFIRDELTRKSVFTRLNLAVSTAFSKDEENRPNDCLIHARRNTDHLIREMYDIAFTQLKRNETDIMLKHLQTDVNTLVDKEIKLGNMMTGTQAFVNESDSNPYTLTIDCNAVPVNSSLAIGFGVYVSDPVVKILDK
ncbi:hypothetical protein [uncultured Methanobrevibacter sp.]|uniref:hypothetical protein n=1 Tax=uncultured Methanobrevibacter sp. TaxID=253161 RepID=UPI0026177A94|nr:hypothetical protein [uncultured Methanobrevibacter sp.]